MNKTVRHLGFWLVGLAAVCLSVALLLQGPIAQNPLYHAFADHRTLLGIPNFWNVVSNLPFLIVGVLGCMVVRRKAPAGFAAPLAQGYYLFFGAVAMVALGSGYYHWAPSNATLVWDRIPMTIGFMALFSIVIGEFVSLKAARKSLYPFIIFGLLAVFYWWFTEGQGRGDLRPYILVQFLPMLLIPAILLFFTSNYTHRYGYWLVLFFYVVAKMCESFDEQILNALGYMSGHALKHVSAALGIGCLLYTYQHRQVRDAGRHEIGR